MKTFKSIFVAATILLFISCAENGREVKPSNLPESVRVTFNAEYSNLEEAKWEKEGDYFEATFKENGMEKSVLYDTEGNVVVTETEINVADLPVVATKYIDQNFDKYAIEEAEMKQSKEGIFYEAEIKSGNQELDLLFDSQGNFIEDEVENDEAKEEDEEDENEREINLNDLPQVIKDAIVEAYPETELLEADEITRKDGGITYDVEIKLNGNITELMYDSQGDFLGFESDDDDDDDENND
jgi:hypothetical protein